MNLMSLKGDGISDLTPVVPSIQHFFSGVVVHHGVVAVLVWDLNVGVPVFMSLGVVSKVDGSGLGAIVVNTVDHSTGDKSISNCVHFFLRNNKKMKIVILILSNMFHLN